MSKRHKHDAAPTDAPTQNDPAQDGQAQDDDTMQDSHSSGAASPRDERQELIEHLQRLQAEFDNYRKRVDREAADHRAASTDALLKELLPIFDTFELSLHHGKDETGAVRGEDLYQGVLLIHDQLKNLLENQGLEPIPSTGQFDPRMHEALMTVAQEGVPKGHIVTLLQPGYQRNGKVIRPAKVSVAK